MQTQPTVSVPEHSSLAPLTAQPPGWVDALLCVTDRRASVVARGVTVDEAGPLALYRTSIDGASRLGAEVLRAGVDEAYVSIGDAVCAARRHPIRFWNFVPAPSVLMAPGLDRYMVFNGGRYDAYARRYGTTRRFGSSLATSSAVGVAGEDLVIFCLASETPGAPVENPRQKSSWHYSTRYGPQPPCFSRATVVTFGHDRRVLIGGTASIVGEESVCIDDAAQQVEETLANLTALIAAARGTSEPSADDIACLSDVRIYVPRAEHAGTIRSLVAARCPGVTRMELTQSQLCRSELLVEIEGVAELELR